MSVKWEGFLVIVAMVINIFVIRVACDSALLIQNTEKDMNGYDQPEYTSDRRRREEGKREYSGSN